MTTANTVGSKLTNITMAASGGGVIAAPKLGASESEVFLYILGFVISVIAFAHNEYHVNKSDTLKQALAKAARYIAVGIFTYPSAYAYAGYKIWDYGAFKGLSGVIATLLIVALMDAWLAGKEKKLKDMK